MATLAVFATSANTESQRRKVSSMPLQKTIPKDKLRKKCVYQLYYMGRRKELAVFCHIGSEGMPIFHPLGEPSFQDVFGLDNYETHWIAEFERDGTPEDLGY
jgi:hypothetical protein